MTSIILLVKRDVWALWCLSSALTTDRWNDRFISVLSVLYSSIHENMSFPKHFPGLSAIAFFCLRSELMRQAIRRDLGDVTVRRGIKCGFSCWVLMLGYTKWKCLRYVALLYHTASDMSLFVHVFVYVTVHVFWYSCLLYLIPNQVFLDVLFFVWWRIGLNWSHIFPNF